MRGVSILVLASTLAVSCSSGRYFPKGAFDDEREWDKFTERRYARNLVALEEESICCSDRGNSYIIRFTRLPAFTNPIVIKVERAQGRWLLRKKVASGKGGYSPGQLITNEVRKVTNEDADRLLAMVGDSSEFWSLPHDVSDPNFVVTDGVRWILEVRHDSKYHFIHENWPQRGILRDVGSLLISLADGNSADTTGET